MALSGQLSDLSLAELIEFFCNQRKTGRLKIAYQKAPGYFYFERGELVDAKIGALSGVDAVYYALTQENASFKFSTAFEPTRRTIHQPWAQVALEGLRRLDEGVAPKEAFPEGELLAHEDEPDEPGESSSRAAEGVAPLSLTVESSAEKGRNRMFVYAAVVAALVLSVAAIGFPAGWYSKRKQVVAAPSQAAPEVKSEEQSAATTAPDASSAPAEADPSGAAASSTDSAFAIRQREERAREARERMLAAQESAQAAKSTAPVPGQPQPTATNPAEVKKPEPAQPAKKTVTVQVTYDENGRVTQASGGDGMAQRIARQKRFPTGKGGSATITIPVN